MTKSNSILLINLQNNFGDQYKLFLLSNPEDDKPVAVVVPRRSLEPETTGILLYTSPYKDLSHIIKF